MEEEAEHRKKKIFAAIAIVALFAIAAWYVVREPEERASEPGKKPVQALYEGFGGEFFAAVPDGWYPHERSGNSVVFTPSKAFSPPDGTEGYAIGRQISVRKGSIAEVVGAKTFADWLTKNCFDATCEMFRARADVANEHGISFSGAHIAAGLADGDVLTYAYDAGGGTIFVLSHYPYVPGSADAAAFDAFVRSFRVPKLMVRDARAAFEKLIGMESPAAGICDEAQGLVVAVTVNEDIPSPRCVKVRGEQTLRVLNNTSKNLELWFGDAAIDSRLYGQAAPKGTFTFSYPFGEFLEQGVHRLRARPFAGPEIWLVK